MVCSLRQYSRWLRDNYADLEYKEIRYSVIAFVIALLFNVFYLVGSTTGKFAQYAVQAFDYMFVILLLWRVETLQSLDETPTQMPEQEEEAAVSTMVPPTALPPNIDLLLEERVVVTQLYLQHDVKIDDLSKAIGTNRSYLSLYFKRQNTTYNAYINGLRIQHFIRLYREAVAAKRSFTSQQLAEESGFRSYSTFGNAFKQKIGQTATSWMREAAAE